jgi:hypothetical protein
MTNASPSRFDAASNTDSPTHFHSVELADRIEDLLNSGASNPVEPRRAFAFVPRREAK